MATQCIVITAVLLIPLFTLTLRALYLIYKMMMSDIQLRHMKLSVNTAICIGSGGHTTEMLKLLKTLDLNKYQPRCYIMADSDLHSEAKILEIEREVKHFAVMKIKRSRNVQQSFFTSIFTTFTAFFYTIPIMLRFKPDVILCNGPGTCVPVCMAAFIFRCLFILDCRIVFVESICRIRTLSLTGKILQWFADIFIVQWPQLRDLCFRAKYFGRLT